MKKILLSTILSVLVFAKVIGQTDYVLTKDLPIAELTGTPNIVTLGPQTSSQALPVGFDFNFYGNNYNQFYINPCGTLSFGASGNIYILGGTPLPNTYMTPNIIGFSIYTTPTNYINGGLVPSYADFTNQNINYFVSGNAPNRVLVVNYKNIVLPTFYGISNTNTINVQIQLFEGSEGKIEIHNTSNRAELTDYGTGSFGQVAIQNSNATKGVVVENSNFNNKNWDLSGKMVRLVYNAPPPPSITIDNTTPTQICGASGTSFVVNFTKTGTFANPSTKVSLYERKEFVGTTIYNNELRSINTTSNTATLTLATNLESSHGGGSPNLSYYIVVSNGTVSTSYPVLVSSPIIDPISVSGTLPITTLAQSVSLNTAPNANITKQWYKSLPVYFQIKRPIGSELTGQTNDNLVITPKETAYYSVKYTDGLGCSSTSDFTRVPITFSLTGTTTAADNTYTEGPLEFGISSSCGGGTAIQEPIDQYSGNLYDAGTHYYAFLGNNDGCYGFNSYFIFRKNNIWGVYSHNRASSGGGAQTNYWTRLFHTKDPFPTIPGARVSATTITNTVPPTSTVWINDTTGEEVTLSLNGATEQPLPLTLISFTGKQTAQNENTLTWKTANEKAFSHFEIQKSSDAKKFEKIGEVKGNNGEVYEYLDNSSLITHHSSLNYYRLKMIDQDGSFSFSKIINIENKKEMELVYPNPADDHIFIENIRGDLRNYKIIDGLGRQHFSLENSRNKLEKLNLEKLQNGLYFIQIQSVIGIEYRKIMIKK